MGFLKKIKAFFTFSNEDINDAEVVVETFLRDPKNKQLNIEDSKDFEKIKTELLSAFEKTWKHIENMPKAEKDGLSLKWLKYFKDIYALPYLGCEWSEKSLDYTLMGLSHQSSRLFFGN